MNELMHAVWWVLAAIEEIEPKITNENLEHAVAELTQQAERLEIERRREAMRKRP